MSWEVGNMLICREIWRSSLSSATLSLIKVRLSIQTKGRGGGIDHWRREKEWNSCLRWQKNYWNKKYSQDAWKHKDTLQVPDFEFEVYFPAFQRAALMEVQEKQR